MDFITLTLKRFVSKTKASTRLWKVNIDSRVSTQNLFGMRNSAQGANRSLPKTARSVR